MEQCTFAERLRIAASRAVQLARVFVLQPLPEEWAVLAIPNLSYDGNPLRGDEEVFPDESLPSGEYHGPWSAEQAVDFLWRSGKVPEWIDLTVVGVDAAFDAYGVARLWWI